MKKMTPLVLIFAIVVLGGLAYAGFTMRKTANPAGIPTAQMIYPSGSVTPTGAQQKPSAETGYQAGITLTINSPANGLAVATPNVTITGKTAPNAEVFVNDATGRADVNGNFSISIALDEGDNTIVVTANDANGNSAEAEVTVSYNPAQ